MFQGRDFVKDLLPPGPPKYLKNGPYTLCFGIKAMLSQSMAQVLEALWPGIATISSAWVSMRAPGLSRSFLGRRLRPGSKLLMTGLYRGYVEPLLKSY